MSPKVIDLFAGVGGLSQGFKDAGFDVVLANEYVKSIADAYKFNHPHTEMVVGDITQLDLQDVFGKYKGKVDVIIGGPPCQGFSQKGKRQSINDERNFLFRYYVNVVDRIRPKYFVMENVPNLLTSKEGFFLNEIKTLFAERGYRISAGVLNAADYGVPQNRNRAIIIGKLGSPAPQLPRPTSRHVTIWDAISDLSFLNSGEGEDVQDYPSSPLSSYQSQMRRDSAKLHNHVATNHSAVALERMSLIPPNAGREVLPQHHRTKSIYSGTWCRMKKNELSVTITTRFDTPSSGKFTHPLLNRAITVREAARIQSFPDTYLFTGNKGSQMKQVGNAVPPLLAKAIAEVIAQDIKNTD